MEQVVVRIHDPAGVVSPETALSWEVTVCAPCFPHRVRLVFASRGREREVPVALLGLRTEGLRELLENRLEGVEGSEARAILAAALDAEPQALSVQRIAMRLRLPRRTVAYRLSRAHAPCASTLVRWARLLRAGWILQHEPVSVAQAARELGFHTAAAFRATLRRRAHLRPSALRQPAGWDELVGRFTRELKSACRSLIVILSTLSASSQELVAQDRPGPGATVVGRITEVESGAALPDAVVTVEGTFLSSRSDAEGRYRIERVPAGPQVLRAVRIGYAPLRQAIGVPATATLTVDLVMARQALHLPGLQVTADPGGRARGELGPATVIGEEAVRNQTAASLAGVLELVPGVPLQPPGLDRVQQFALRSVPVSPGGAAGVNAGAPGAGTLASFGTMILLDGVPVSNNANLQSLGPRGEFDIPTSAGGGVDLRRFPASTIERVEVVRGLPSVRYGDLTQGAVLVETRAGAVEPELLTRLDPRGGELSLVGGKRLSSTQTGTVALDAARTAIAPGETDDQSYRFSGQLAHRWESGRWRLDSRLDGFQLVEDRPENEQFPGVASQSRDNGLRISERARLQHDERSALEFTGALEYVRQRSFSQASRIRTAMPFTDRLTEGRQEGKFIGGIYSSRVDLEGDAGHLFLRMEETREPQWLDWPQKVRLGAEFRREWGSGPGYQFDIEFPPQVEFNGINGFDRPRSYDDIPPIVTTGLYLEDRIQRPVGSGGWWAVQAGVRADLLHDGDWWFSAVRDVAVQPRLMAEIAPVEWLRFRVGAGRVAKTPLLSSLSPGLQYYDLVNVNYYATDPAERLAVLTTRIVDKTNPELGYAVADNFEAGFEADLGRDGAQVTVSLFHSTVEGAVGILAEPTSFLREHFRIVDSTVGTGRPPAYEEPAYAADSVPILIDRPGNSATMVNRGAELTALFPEITALRTRIEAQGAWIQSRVENHGLAFNPEFSDFQMGLAPRAPYWNGATATGERLLLTTRLIHQLPSAGLVVTGIIQFTLREQREDLGATDTLSFAGYLTRGGRLVPVPASDRSAPEYQDLRVSRRGLMTEPQVGPSDWLLSLQVAKSLPLRGRLLFYAFNAFNKVGNFGDATTAARLYPSARFGLEVTMPLTFRD